ncbi:hypothetical protein D9757_002474 [Collybiopsis confluens]|uniref:Chromosome transmission fidelity protein 8 n=1 Tax=Collybiopsis confluens TaxID=2823264 RepID=A0A8H5HY40_9AGAR|nr:hypothetical protein D9757_002474 [Collybiopsis confluens]
MIIPVSFSSSPTQSFLPQTLAKISNDQVVLLEFQGALGFESSSQDQNGERDGQFIGTLTVDEDLKRPTLRIGHNVLEGKITDLPKPLAVLHRSAATRAKVQSSLSHSEGDEDVTIDHEDDDELSPTTSDVRWNAIAIIKRKIIFSNRPMIVVGRQS